MGDCNPEKSLSRKIDCYCHWDLEEDRHRKLAKKILNAKLCINFSQYVLLYGVKGILHTKINFASNLISWVVMRLIMVLWLEGSKTPPNLAWGDQKRPSSWKCPESGYFNMKHLLCV